jgi:polyisoprenoid-binding protein YceI
MLLRLSKSSKRVSKAVPQWIFAACLAAACTSEPKNEQPEAVVGAPRAAANAGEEKARGRVFSFSQADSAVSFVAAKVTRSHHGFFGTFSGYIDLVGDQPEASSVKVEIDMTSVQTDEAQLTTHLKTPDLLDVSKFPKASFVSTSIQKSSDGKRTHVITGDLELHGVRKSIQFPADIRVQTGGVEADGEFNFKRQDFGITYPGMPDDLIKDDVLIRLKIRAKADSV